MKFKRIMATLLASVMFMSVAAIPAFAANTGDTQFSFYWQGSDRTKYTETRTKENNTPVYIKATPNTLPYNGFYVGTEYYSSGWHKASADSYLLNDYAGHTIRSNATSRSMVNTDVRIKGTYRDRTYNWGSVRGVWSPDTASAQNYVSLN